LRHQHPSGWWAATPHGGSPDLRSSFFSELALSSARQAGLLPTTDVEALPHWSPDTRAVAADPDGGFRLMVAFLRDRSIFRLPTGVVLPDPTHLPAFIPDLTPEQRYAWTLVLFQQEYRSWQRWRSISHPLACSLTRRTPLILAPDGHASERNYFDLLTLSTYQRHVRIHHTER
ncbi:MAG: hypothetical protein ACOCXA_04765, partial [Planctomycetota bacterium]